MSMSSVGSLISMFICITLAIFVYENDRRATENRVFAIAMLHNALLAVCDAVMHVTTNDHIAYCFIALRTCWPLNISLLLHFSMAYTRSHVLRHRWVLYLMYASGIIVSTVFLANFLLVMPLMTPEGYEVNFAATSPLANIVGGLWSMGGSLVFCQMTLRYAWSRTDTHSRAQAYWISGALCVPIFMILGSYLLKSVFDIAIPEIAQPATIVQGGLMMFAISRYQLLRVDPALAAENILQTISEWCLVIDRNLIIRMVNPAAAHGLGYTPEELDGQSVDMLFERAFARQLERRLLAAEYRLQDVELCLHRKDATQVWVDLSSMPILRDERSMVGVVFVARDVTESREMTRRIAYQASHDAVTELMNRAAFDEQLEYVYQQCCEREQQAYLLLIDLDKFKIINDTGGHMAGDQLLRLLALEMRKAIRSSDFLARLGGDEFAVILTACPAENACAIAETIYRSIRDYRFHWDGKSFSVGASVGVAPISPIFPSADHVLAMADEACYIAKGRGGNQVYLQSDNDISATGLQNSVSMVQLLQQALDEDRFTLYFQPYTGVTQRMSGIHGELLLRMRDGEDRVLSPGLFLPVAQRYGLLRQIDRWVLHHFFSWFSALPPEVQRTFEQVNINISGVSFNDAAFPDLLREVFATYAVDPHIICFEITETTAINNFQQSAAIMREMHELGCRFALDDFGCGLASLSYLQRLPFDFLKIDGSFVRGVHNNILDRTIVEMVQQMARALCIQTVAEYVEDDATLQMLHEIGVDYAQGFLIAKPHPLEDIVCQPACRM